MNKVNSNKYKTSVYDRIDKCINEWYMIFQNGSYTENQKIEQFHEILMREFIEDKDQKDVADSNKKGISKKIIENIIKKLEKKYSKIEEKYIKSKQKSTWRTKIREIIYLERGNEKKTDISIKLNVEHAKWYEIYKYSTYSKTEKIDKLKGSFFMIMNLYFENSIEGDDASYKEHRYREIYRGYKNADEEVLSFEDYDECLGKAYKTISDRYDKNEEKYQKSGDIFAWWNDFRKIIDNECITIYNRKKKYMHTKESISDQDIEEEINKKSVSYFKIGTPIKLLCLISNEIKTILTKEQEDNKDGQTKYEILIQMGYTEWCLKILKDIEKAIDEDRERLHTEFLDMLDYKDEEDIMRVVDSEFLCFLMEKRCDTIIEILETKLQKYHIVYGIEKEKTKNTDRIISFPIKSTGYINFCKSIRLINIRVEDITRCVNGKSRKEDQKSFKYIREPLIESFRRQNSIRI